MAVMRVQTTATMKEPARTEPRCQVTAYLRAVPKRETGLFSRATSCDWVKNQSIIHMIVENCSMAMTKAIHQYIMKISTQI